MTEHLKPCPFCAGKAEFENDNGEWFVFCEKCGSMTVPFETKPEAKDAWNRRNETELVKQFIINNDKNLIVKFERSEPNARMSFPIGISYDFDNIRDLNDVEKEVLSKLLTDVKKELCDDENELEAENKRLREALELIAKSKFYFARGEEDKQLRRVCEIAKDCLKEIEK